MEVQDNSPNWLTDEQQRNWRAYLEGSTILSSALTLDLEITAGLSMSEYEILVRLSETKNKTLRMSVLAEQLTHSRSRVSHTVRRLEQLGYVERVKSARDKRGIECVLTEQGAHALATIAPRHVESVRERIVDVISDEELEQLGNIFRRIARASGTLTSDMRRK